MKKSNKLIIIIFAIVVSFALFIAESYYTIAILKKVTLNYNEIMTAVENPDDVNSDNNTNSNDNKTLREIVKEDYTEENYKLAIKEYNKAFELLSEEEKENLSNSLELLFKEKPHLCPPEGYDASKCLTDKWYWISSFLFSVQFTEDIKEEDIVPFNDFYYLSNSEEGQYELLQKMIFYLDAYYEEKPNEEKQEPNIEENTIPPIEKGELVGTEILGEFSEEKYKIVISELDKVNSQFSDEDKETIGAQTKVTFELRPDLAPAKKYDPAKCKTDKWYLITSMIIAVECRLNPNADIPTFDEYYNLSKTKEGQYELVTEFINVTQDGLNPEK